MKTLLAFISIVLLIIFFGDLIFKDNNSQNSGDSKIANSSKNISFNVENNNSFFISRVYIPRTMSIKEIDSLTAFENLNFTKENASKLIVKL